MPLSILIAEDNPGIRLAIEDYLRLSGYTVVAAENGREALNLLQEYHPHLLISDIKMPEKDGYELVEQIRQNPAFRFLPVIFLTERNSIEERIHGYQVGCDVYLPKPFEMKELGAIVRSLLERSQIFQAELLLSIEQSRSQSANATSVDRQATEITEDSLHLTQREKQVLQLLIRGLSNIEIGNNLYLSSRTVEKYVSSLLRKTDTNNRVDLVRFAIENHLLD
jgi:DNA-binding NarL/FixJ family response regulator